MKSTMKHSEQKEKDFDQEIKALLSDMAEICVHDYLAQQSEKESNDE